MGYHPMIGNFHPAGVHGRGLWLVFGATDVFTAFFSVQLKMSPGTALLSTIRKAFPEVKVSFTSSSFRFHYRQMTRPGPWYHLATR